MQSLLNKETAAIETHILIKWHTTGGSCCLVSKFGAIYSTALFRQILCRM